MAHPPLETHLPAQGLGERGPPGSASLRLRVLLAPQFNGAGGWARGLRGRSPPGPLGDPGRRPPSGVPWKERPPGAARANLCPTRQGRRQPPARPDSLTSPPLISPFPISLPLAISSRHSQDQPPSPGPWPLGPSPVSALVGRRSPGRQAGAQALRCGLCRGRLGASLGALWLPIPEARG